MNTVTGRGKAPAAKRKISGMRVRRPSNGTGLSVTTEYVPEKTKRGELGGWYPGQDEQENFFDDHKKAIAHTKSVIHDLMGVPEEDMAATEKVADAA